ncbi:MAG: glucosidase [Cytophagaceae bacterium]|nr:glucosidase [Cytophagaceae bacterium]
MAKKIAERERLKIAKENNPWKKWGPYLTERQWGTVREDYSPDGSAWNFITHDMARSKAYRWGEEGIAGISDNKSILCFALGLWNEKDNILKERLYGLAGNEGNHGEDVKEMYYYLDSTPTHSYMKMLYKYPHAEFPYVWLRDENKRRSKYDAEFEIIDTKIFDDDRYFDVFVEYAKADVEDILIKITAYNRGIDPAPLHILPTIWFRNTWKTGVECYEPRMFSNNKKCIEIDHQEFGEYRLYFEKSPTLLFCENETNYKKLYDVENSTPYCKDGINDFVVDGITEAVNPNMEGTKAAGWYKMTVEGGDSVCIKLRLSNQRLANPFHEFNKIFSARMKDADDFYADVQKCVKDEELKKIQRQAYAGMMWSKQFYYFNIAQWLDGDPGQVPPPAERKKGRNAHWKHLNNSNIISMPDKWEYPWYAAWDLAFHCIPIARIDPDFAKRQLIIMVREYYMHPNGQIPAYEWNFNDVNPPVHAWATWKVYEIDKNLNNGKGDTLFLERVFHKLLMNFTWWVNQKDHGGNNIFEGGFLGLDNIGIFDRSQPLPTGGTIEQSDGTSWMAMYSLNMLRISCELSLQNPAYQDTASKFFEHFLFIAGASVNIGGDGISLWDEEDKFFYDVLLLPSGQKYYMKVRSMVGLIPLFAVETLHPDLINRLPEFKRRCEWVIQNRPDLASLISRWYDAGKGETRLLSLLRGHRMKKILERMLDEEEFLSDYGVRALSKYHKDHPYRFHFNGNIFSVNYQPGESTSSLFGGNSNWRGPIWFPVNFMIIESLREFYSYYGDDFKIEYPTGSGKFLSLQEIADGLSKRLLSLFRSDHGRRPVFGYQDKIQTDPHFKDHILFYEYFHGDNGRGAGASHQTGWTGLLAELINNLSQEKRKKTADKND